MMCTAPMRMLAALATGLAVMISVGGCAGLDLGISGSNGSSSSLTPTDRAAAGNGPTDGPTDGPADGPAGALPNNVPLPPGARLVSGPTPSKATSTGTGWTAVAVTPVATLPANVTNALYESLVTNGWTLQQNNQRPAGTTSGAGTTIGAQKASTDASRPYSGEWLEVSVTTPLASSGPAITYRYAAVTAPQRSLPLTQGLTQKPSQ